MKHKNIVVEILTIIALVIMLGGCSKSPTGPDNSQKLSSMPHYWVSPIQYYPHLDTVIINNGVVVSAYGFQWHYVSTNIHFHLQGAGSDSMTNFNTIFCLDTQMVNGNAFAINNTQDTILNGQWENSKFYPSEFFIPLK